METESASSSGTKQDSPAMIRYDGNHPLVGRKDRQTPDTRFTGKYRTNGVRSVVYSPPDGNTGGLHSE